MRRSRQRGQTALMWAAAEGNVEAVEALLKAGADLHARLESGFTPLLFAVREGRIGVVRALLKAGADVNETIEAHKSGEKRPAQVPGAPRAGTSALRSGGRERALRTGLLSARSGRGPERRRAGLHGAARHHRVRKPGGGDNDPPPDGSGNMTSLRAGARSWSEQGANINARMTKKVNFGLTSLNTMGATPFFLAARTADAELMRSLAALGADPLIPNADNSTPLMAAAGLGTRSPGEDAGTESEVVEAMQVALELGRRYQRGRQQRRNRDARRGLQELPGSRRIPGREGREDRDLEPQEQTGLDAADHRGRLPVRQLQALARHGGRAAQSDGDDRLGQSSIALS